MQKLRQRIENEERKKALVTTLETQHIVFRITTVKSYCKWIIQHKGEKENCWEFKTRIAVCDKLDKEGEVTYTLAYEHYEPILKRKSCDHEMDAVRLNALYWALKNILDVSKLNFIEFCVEHKLKLWDYNARNVYDYYVKLALSWFRALNTILQKRNINQEPAFYAAFTEQMMVFAGEKQKEAKLAANPPKIRVLAGLTPEQIRERKNQQRKVNRIKEKEAKAKRKALKESKLTTQILP